MNVFLLLLAFVREIERVMNGFWWGGGVEDEEEFGGRLGNIFAYQKSGVGCNFTNQGILTKLC